MRYLVVGLGNIGAAAAGAPGRALRRHGRPVQRGGRLPSVRDVPVDAYDAAVLAIPDDDKIDLVTYLLEQGKHVLVEKPLPLPDEATAQRLESLARSRGLALYTAYNHRFEPMLAAFQEQVAAGTIGEVYHGRLFYGNGTVKHVAGHLARPGARRHLRTWAATCWICWRSSSAPPLPLPRRGGGETARSPSCAGEGRGWG